MICPVRKNHGVLESLLKPFFQKKIKQMKALKDSISPANNHSIMALNFSCSLSKFEYLCEALEYTFTIRKSGHKI